MANPVIKKNIRHYEGVIDGSETVTDAIPCHSSRPMDLKVFDSVFGGGTLTIEHRPEGATGWFQWSTKSLTEDGAVTFYPPTDGHVRFSLAGGTGYTINWRYMISASEVC